MPAAAPNGWRDYDDAAVERVHLIAERIRRGLTLDGVKQLAPCLDMHDPAECDNPDLPLQTYRARLAVLEDRLARLGHHRDQLIEQIHELRRPDEQTEHPR